MHTPGLGVAIEGNSLRSTRLTSSAGDSMNQAQCRPWPTLLGGTSTFLSACA